MKKILTHAFRCLFIFSFVLFFSANETPIVCGQEIQPETKITYDDHVKPIFNQRCSSCHGSSKKEADLDLTNYTSLMIGGGSGEVISAGSASDSYLYSLITHEQSPEMPPSGTKIPDAEIKTIADWIHQGALENAGSKAKKSKPKMDLALSSDATKRPETVAVPLLMPLEPVIKTMRPSASAIATSPWAAVVAVAAPKQVLLYSSETLELLGVLPMEEGLAHSLRFSRSGSLLLAGGGKDGQLGKTIIWDVKTGQRVASVGEELDSILAADISSNHELVAFGGPNKLVKIYSVVDGRLLFEINKHTDWVTALEFSSDGKLLATGDRNGGLHVWDTKSGAERFALTGHSLSISGVSFRADSKILASASEDTNIRLWEMDNGGTIKNWGAHGGGVTAIEFLRDGNIVSCGRDKLAKTWDQNGQQLRQFSGLVDVAVAVSFCDETARVIAADWTGAIKVWNANDGSEVGTLVANPPTLDERLAGSQRALSVAIEKQQPLIAQVAQTQSKLVDVTTSLATIQESRLQIEAKIAASQSEFETVQQQLEATVAEQSAFKNEQSTKFEAQPLIQQAYSDAVAAAQKLPSDEDLVQIVSQLEAKKTSNGSRINELESLVKNLESQGNAVQTKVGELNQSLQSDSQQLQKLTLEVSQLQSQLEPLSQQIETQTQAAASVAVEVNAAQTDIEKWNRNREFIKQIEHLTGQLGATEQEIVERQTIVEEAKHKLQAAETEAEAAKQQQSAAEDNAEKIRQQIFELQSGS